ncbi:MAG: ribosome-associated translation inhibitor RaiA [Candidatus Pacebacteria bacterium]|nr:ribosome-associated translation inhibitor RaiA [Candidatus Paceibacterota bacterium]
MKIDIKTKNFKLTPFIEDYVNKKINSLDKFTTGDDFEIEALVEIEKTTFHHKKGQVFKAECHMKLPGKNIMAKSLLEDLYLAINEMKDGLQRQMKEYKNKLISKRKRGARAVKKEIRLSPQARFRKRERIIEEGE